jgi:hypothetical protein
MSKIRFASAASFIVLGSMIAGCAAPQTRVTTSGFGGRAGGEVGLATRALAALNANDIPTAIDFAERAVEKTPDDAGFRALLGNAISPPAALPRPRPPTRMRCRSTRRSRRSS